MSEIVWWSYVYDCACVIAHAHDGGAVFSSRASCGFDDRFHKAAVVYPRPSIPSDPRCSRCVEALLSRAFDEPVPKVAKQLQLFAKRAAT